MKILNGCNENEKVNKKEGSEGLRLYVSLRKSGWQYKCYMSKLGQLMTWRITELAYQHSVLELHAQSLWLFILGLLGLCWIGYVCEENRPCDSIVHVESFLRAKPNLKMNHSFESVHFMNGSNGLATIQNSIWILWTAHLCTVYIAVS